MASHLRGKQELKARLRAVGQSFKPIGRKWADETVKTARERNKPYAVVLNACPVKRGVREAPAVAQSRAYLEREGVPVFAGQISHRASFSSTLAEGASAGEAEPASLAAAEIAKLWTAVEKSVAAINQHYAAAAATASLTQGQAA